MMCISKGLAMLLISPTEHIGHTRPRLSYHPGYCLAIFAFCLVTLLSFTGITVARPTKAQLRTPALQIYPAPDGIHASPDYTVTVNGKPVFVYDAKVQIERRNPQTHMGVCSFDFSKPVVVKVTANTSMQHVVIRPKARHITPHINGNSITLTLKKPCKLTIEPDGTGMTYSALALFANAPETSVPNPTDPNVRYFGPGIHNVGQITLHNNETVYLAGGAYVKGWLVGENVSNVRILGRGILDRTVDDPKQWPSFMWLNSCRNVTLDGITLMGGIRGWSVVPRESQDLVFHDVKLVCTGPNADGFDICSCQRVTIDDVFIRNWDDCVVLKAYKDIDTRDITVKNSVLWIDLAQGLEIGYELGCQKICNVRWDNIDIIHAYSNAAMSIHNSGHATVEDVMYNNIRVEDLDPAFGRTDIGHGPRLFDFWIGRSGYTKDGGQGKIRNITFNNINVSTVGGVMPESRITGFDAEHNIDGITFKNLCINNHVILDLTAANFLVAKQGTDPEQNVRNIRFLKK
ncbi:MAG TPA: glycosyl hydrolase family 28 protein [Armatimonadota bacterium]|nr:glycosyl hydrolase family 28 protein [Armatimonadota bacterium]